MKIEIRRLGHIKKLTETQEKKIPQYLDKWLKIGLRTESMGRNKASESINWIYKNILDKPAPKIIFADSPVQAVFMGAIIDKLPEILPNLKMGKPLESQLERQLESHDNKWIQQHWGDHYISNWWVGWIGFYDFILNELFEDRQKDFTKFQEFIKHWQELHIIYPYDGICFVVDFPKVIERNVESRLHRDGGPALEYRDTYSLYSLNGIRVTKEIAETKPGDITKEMITKEQNADIRREIIRKVGNERLLALLDYTVIDSFGEYELITFNIGDGRIRPYLKMINPSIGCVHVEGVSPEIKTVKEAITFRNGLKEYEAPLALS